MQSILVINAGSTSLKYALFTYSKIEEMQRGDIPITTGAQGMRESFKKLLRTIGDISDIVVVGHRVVHGGPLFFEPTLLDQDTLLKLSRLSSFAPLHNPTNLAAVSSVKEFMLDIPNVAVFDTGFFKDLPDVTRYYPLPIPLQDKLGVRRYGFHGISHEYALEEAVKELKKKKSATNLITIHLGGGASMTAVRKGKPVDTSMGFTPLEGLMMLTRSGDIDPGLALYLSERGTAEAKRLLYTQSGIAGVSDFSDYQQLLEAVKKKDKRAALTFDMFIYRIRKYIGSYLAVLGSVEALVFTGKIGAGDPATQKAILKDFKLLSGTKVITIEPDEEHSIALKAKSTLEKKKEEENE